jgi:hypothetical protein
MVAPQTPGSTANNVEESPGTPMIVGPRRQPMHEITYEVADNDSADGWI